MPTSPNLVSPDRTLTAGDDKFGTWVSFSVGSPERWGLGLALRRSHQDRTAPACSTGSRGLVSSICSISSFPTTNADPFTAQLLSRVPTAFRTENICRLTAKPSVVLWPPALLTH